MSTTNRLPSARITLDEIAAALAVSKWTVRRALEAKTIPGVRLGNRWMVSRAAFTRWLETCGEVPASTPEAKGE